MHTVVIIDDHHVVREGFKRVLDGSTHFRVSGEAANVINALEACRRLQPDLIMTDISLGGPKSGLELLPELAQASPHSKRVIVSMHDDPAMINRAFTMGADGFISKAELPHAFLDLLKCIMDGQRVTSRTLRKRSRQLQLTTRERDIISGILQDKAPKAIAIDLGISDKTLYRQRANLMQKIGAKTTLDVIRLANEHGWGV